MSGNQNKIALLGKNIYDTKFDCTKIDWEKCGNIEIKHDVPMSLEHNYVKIEWEKLVLNNTSNTSEEKTEYLMK